MTNRISEERQVAFYAGIGLSIVGGLFFASTFVSFAMHFGDFSNFAGNARSIMVRTFVGVAFLIAGTVVRGIGVRGLAGSGVILDPEQARKDLEPFSRMAGGMVKDALDEADVKIGAAESTKVVMLKCASCGTLNGEDARYCKQCGTKL